MKRYVPAGCRKCDFEGREMPRRCKLGLCNTYEESYFIMDVDYEIGCASLEEFNEKYGTDWEEKKTLT